MAVRLGFSREPRWRDLGLGVRVLMRPATSIEHRAAEHAARAKIQSALAGAEALDALGLDGAAAERLRDPGYLIGVTHWLVASELGALVIDDWTGVNDAATDAPAPVTPAAIADLMRIERIEAAFVAEAMALAVMIDAEGKGSPPPPSGQGEGAANTAHPAATTAPPAPPAMEPARST